MSESPPRDPGDDGATSSEAVQALIAGFEGSLGSAEPRVSGVCKLLDEGSGYVQTVQAGEVVWEHGSPAADSFAVLKGVMRVELPGQTPCLLCLVFPGEVADYDYLLIPPRHFGRAVALVDATLLRGGERAIRGFVSLGDPEGMATLTHAAEMARVGRRRIAALSNGAVGVRLGRLLLILLERVGQPVPGGELLSLSLTRGDLASMVGCRRETAARAIGRWRDDGIIEQRPEGLVLLDRPRLESACQWSVLL